MSFPYGPFVLSLAVVALGSASPVALRADDVQADRQIATHVHFATSSVTYRSQLLGPLDHPIGDAITMADASLPARMDAKGNLSLDVKGNGSFSGKFTHTATVAWTLPASGGKEKTQGKGKGLTFTLLLDRHGDAWTYRNLTELVVTIGSENAAIVDVDGDGSYNEVGIDGVALQGGDMLFPLPDSDNRWCSRTLDITSLSLGPLGESLVLMGHPLTALRPETLPVLRGVIEARLQLGLIPRPEDPQTSRDLQAHCHYMALHGHLGHDEVVDSAGYTFAGATAGRYSILTEGAPPAGVAPLMMASLYHRRDMIRPDTLSFGVGFDATFGGINGCSHLGRGHLKWWPVLCPAPDQTGVPAKFGSREDPDPVPGNTHLGYPITVYFAEKCVLTKASLTFISGRNGNAASGTEIDCVKSDPSSSLRPDQDCLALIPTEPLETDAVYEVTMAATVRGEPWNRTWRFATGRSPR